MLKISPGIKVDNLNFFYYSNCTDLVARVDFVVVVIVSCWLVGWSNYLKLCDCRFFSARLLMAFFDNQAQNCPREMPFNSLAVQNKSNNFSFCCSSPILGVVFPFCYQECIIFHSISFVRNISEMTFELFLYTKNAHTHVNVIENCPPAR